MKQIMNDKNGLVVFTLCFILLWSLIPFSYAEIPITHSMRMNGVIFDGKWTFTTEWKASSLDRAGPIYIRSAHLENYIYILLDVVSDTTIDKNKDSAMVCFDSENNQSPSPDDDDYCFFVKLADKEPITLCGFGSIFFFRLSNLNCYH